jgi:hypothetical protein
MMPNNPRNKTTAVLARAAWADGSSWNKVTIELQRPGFNVVAGQIPLTSFADDVASVALGAEQAGRSRGSRRSLVWRSGHHGSGRRRIQHQGAGLDRGGRAGRKRDSRRDFRPRTSACKGSETSA